MTESNDQTTATGPVDIGLLLSSATLDGEGALTRQIYRLLRRLIVNLSLRPNQVLFEKDVAAGLKISKTPVREALIRLAEDGLVRIAPRSGTYVAPIDASRAVEGFFVRASLEASCAELLAEKRLAPGTVRELRGILAEQRDAIAREDYQAFFLLDGTFHDALFHIANLPYTHKLIEESKYEVDRIRNLKLLYRIRKVEQVLADHTGVVDAIEAGDGDRARRVMRAHLASSGDAIGDMTRNEELKHLFQCVQQARRGRQRSR